MEKKLMIILVIGMFLLAGLQIVSVAQAMKKENGSLTKPLPLFKHVKVHVVDKEGNAISSALVCLIEGNDLAPPGIVDSDLTNIDGNTTWMDYIPGFWGNWIEVHKAGYNTKEIWNLGSDDWNELEAVLTKKGGGSVGLGNRLYTNTLIFQLLQNHLNLFFIFK